MKKSLLFTIALAGSMLASCNMNLKPIGAVDAEEAINTAADVMASRNYLYVTLRATTSSGFFTYPEIQADMFNGLTLNGNRLGNIANGTILSGDGDIEGFWAALYSYINNVNFFLEKAEPVYNKYVEENETEKVNAVARYIAEARFIRAYYYAEMMDRWCQLYTPQLGSTPGTGLPVVTEYNPTTDRAKYKGRNTLDELIKFINDEFEASMQGLKAYEAIDPSQLVPMAEYLNTNVVKAMAARFNLWIADYTYPEAYTALGIQAGEKGVAVANRLAKELIDCGVYTLTPRAQYTAMWTSDTSNEVIWMPFEDNTELGGAIGVVWLTTYDNTCDYIPTPACIQMYAEAGTGLQGRNDIRYAAFIGSRNLTTEQGVVKSPTFTKFPGNPQLMTSAAPNIVNKPKAFRLSEMVLIAAETAQMLGQEGEANGYLNDLESNRINKYANPTHTGDDLRNAIRTARAKELIGEGFRISDLRRWGLGFTRVGEDFYSDFTSVSSLLTPTGLTVTYAPNDYRYTWPIPSGEIQTNPQIAGQQNPGYGK